MQIIERTDLSKVFKIHQPMTRFIMIPKDLEYLRFLQVESKCSHGYFQFVVVDAAILVRIKQFKRLLYLLLLLVSKLGTWMRSSLFGFLYRRGIHRGVHTSCDTPSHTCHVAFCETAFFLESRVLPFFCVRCTRLAKRRRRLKNKRAYINTSIDWYDWSVNRGDEI